MPGVESAGMISHNSLPWESEKDFLDHRTSGSVAGGEASGLD